MFGGAKMIDVKKVKEYIEKKNHTELTPLQYQILKAIVRGDEVYTPRGVGRSFLYNGYADYLINVVGHDTNRSIQPEDFDSIFTASMMEKDPVFKKHKIEDTFKSIRERNEDRFLRDYECIYNKE